MSRALSSAFRTAQHAAETGEIAVVLLTITHEDLDEPFRFSSDPTSRLSVDPLTYGTVSRGETFTFLPFDLTLPDDQEQSAPRAEIRMDNIDRSLIPLLRSTATPPTVLIEIVLASDPDTVEASYPDFIMSGVNYNAGEIAATVTLDGLAAEPFPGDRFVPSRFPSLFNKQT